MAVYALWSAPRARSTAFYRSMVERGDMLALHEPFWNLQAHGDTEIAGHTVRTPAALLAWMSDDSRRVPVFLKETTDHRYEEILTDQRFLAEARHTFLIRRPDEIVASYYALWPAMRLEDVGLETMYELYTAVGAAGGYDRVVVDSDDLATRPEATMATYCATVGLPFLPDALSWEPGARPEWRRSQRWHDDVNASSGFTATEGAYALTVENSEKLARFATHHLPFYEMLHAQRLIVRK